LGPIPLELSFDYAHILRIIDASDSNGSADEVGQEMIPPISDRAMSQTVPPDLLARVISPHQRVRFSAETHAILRTHLPYAALDIAIVLAIRFVRDFLASSYDPQISLSRNLSNGLFAVV
jgi:hypothetical protein